MNVIAFVKGLNFQPNERQNIINEVEKQITSILEAKTVQKSFAQPWSNQDDVLLKIEAPKSKTNELGGL